MIEQTRRLAGRPLFGSGSRLAVLAVILAAAFVMRWPFLGHPMIHVDEQFYLLAGQRMLEGWIPYVDLWDRKPVGLFLIYGAIRLLGGDGVVQYQLVATLFAGVTSYVVYLIAQRAVPPSAALASGLIYAAWLAPINGAGGQSPVFYNFFMALSALLVLRAQDAEEAAAYFRYGLAAMFSAGLALQIKYVAVIEGVFFGLWLLGTGWRFNRGWKTMAVLAAMLTLAALAPTLAAATWFAAIGAFEPFLHANFVSIFDREAAPGWFEREALNHTLRLLLFPTACAAAALGIAWLRGIAKDRLFLSLWCACAGAGFAAIGNYFDHYALPLLVPVAIALSRLAVLSWAAPLIWALLLLQATVYGLLRYSPTADNQAIMARMAATIEPALASGDCLFVADTPMILYLATKACGPWRYSFPFHLIDGTEFRSGDADQRDAMRSILATRPGAIVTGSPDFTPTLQLANVMLLRKTLTSDYILTGRYPDRGRIYTVWIRRDLSKLQGAEAARYRTTLTVAGSLELSSD